jgi:hypothetical protein
MLGGGPSGLMYILRARALETERGESPDLSVIYAPGTLRQARRRLVVVWAFSVAWTVGVVLGGVLAVGTYVLTFLGLVLALSTQFEAAWIGSPIRPLTRYAIPIALLGLALPLVIHGVA